MFKKDFSEYNDHVPAQKEGKYMLDNKYTKNIQLFYIFYLIFATIFGITAFLIKDIENFWSPISFAIICFSPLFVVFFFEIFIPFNLKIKGYSGFWKTLFTVFLYNSKNSKNVFEKSKKEDFKKQFIALICLSAFILILTSIFLIISIVNIGTFNSSLMVLIVWFIILHMINTLFILTIRKKGNEIWIQIP